MQARSPGAVPTRQWAWDLGALALAISIGALFLVDSISTGRMPEGALRYVDIAIGVIACALVPLRRRYPAALALTFGLTGIVSATAAGAGLVFLFTAVKRCRLRLSIPIIAVNVALVPTYTALNPDPNASFWTAVTVGVATTLAIVAWGFYGRTREQLLASLTERAERAESEQRLRVEQAQVAERSRIAREMHDVLAHRLSLLSLHASALEVGATGGPDGGLDRERLAEAARVIRNSAHEALEELRGAIGVLRDDQLAGGSIPERPQPDLGALPDLVGESREAGMTLSAEFDCAELETVPAAAGRHAYRIVQEGLTNARKHAPGCSVDLRVGGRPGQGLEVEVRNRLPVDRAPDVALPGAASGLVGLTERAELAGGRLEHGETADGDFRVLAWLPWSTAGGEEREPDRSADTIAAPPA